MAVGEWIACGKPLSEVAYARPRVLEPGMQIEVVGGDRYLIGEINDLGGVCDCCTYDRKSIVVRYRKVIDLKEIESD